MKLSELPEYARLQPTSEAINPHKQRFLLQTIRDVTGVLTDKEYMAILKVCNDCVNRVCQENGVELD